MALLVTFSNSFPQEKRAGFQFLLFGTSTAAGAAYCLQQEPKLFNDFWVVFVGMPPFVKFSLTLVIIGVAYFGAALYSVGMQDEVSPAAASSKSNESGSAVTANASPALSDNNTDFEVPATLPAKDSELFEVMFEQ